MSRRLRLFVLLVVPALCFLLAAPSCSPSSITKLANRTGHSVDDLSRSLDKVSRQTGTSESLARRLAASGPAIDVLDSATEPAVQAACQLVVGKFVSNPTDPAVTTWLWQINSALAAGEPMKEACDVVGKLAGAAPGF